MDDEALFCNIALLGVLMFGFGIAAVTVLSWWFQDPTHSTFVPMCLAGGAAIVASAGGAAVIVWRERTR